MKTFKELVEKTLTPAELKKREEIAKAMERENPGMDMSKKMAIATAAAKRVAEDVDEAYMSSDRSKQMFKRKELDHELRHEVEPKRSEPTDPHAVHINGKKWKTFPTKSHATNVAKKIAGATVVKESIDEGKIPEMRYSEVMKKIKSGTHEATHDVKPGKHVELRHINSGKKTTVYVKESDELDEAKVIGHVGDVAGHGKVVQCAKCDTDLRDDHGYALDNKTYVCRNGDKCSMRQSKNSLAAAAAKGQKPRWRTDESLDEGKVNLTQDHLDQLEKLHGPGKVIKKTKHGMFTYKLDKPKKVLNHSDIAGHVYVLDGKKLKHYTSQDSGEMAGANESVELDEATDHHAEAMEHKKQSDAAMVKNDMEAYHQHMSAHHESLGQWHESKGRSSSADKEFEKAEKHHELSLKKSNQKNEGTEMLSFKNFQQELVEAKKKCKESSGEIELVHGEMLDKDEENGKEKKEMCVKEGQAPVAPVPGTKSKTHAIMVHPESKQRVTIPRKNVKNYPASEGWKEVAPGMKESVEELDEELFYQHAKKLMDQGRDSHKPSSDAPYGRSFYGTPNHTPPGKSRLHVLDNGKKVKTVHVPDEHIEKLDTKGKLEWPDHMDPTIEKKHFDAYAKTNSKHISEPVKESVESIDEAAITHVVAKEKLAAHKEFMDKEGFKVTTKPLPKSHPKHATHMGIVSKNTEEDGYHESGNAYSVIESVELEEALKGDMHPDAGKVLKHIKPEHHDKYKPYLKNGVYKGNFADRSAVLRDAERAGHTVDEAVSPFDWKAYAKAKGPESSNKTKTFHDVKKTSTGTVYTKQVNPDGMSKGSGDDAAKSAEVEQAPKRGRGRPAGVGAKTGSYKPRDPAAKAASAAKSAASKAANRASRNEEFDNEFMGSLIEGFEDEDFDEFLYCEEFDELDEATQEALINFINEKCASKMKESLTGNQHKLDKNKNGKIDSHDFKLLRKEETEQVQESVNTYAAFLTKKQ
jgi:hypothetical protein